MENVHVGIVSVWMLKARGVWVLNAHVFGCLMHVVFRC